MYRKEYSKFSTSVHEIFHEVDNQINELKQERDSLMRDIEAVQNEKARLEKINKTQASLLEETEKDRKQIVQLKREIDELNEMIVRCSHSDQETQRVQAIRDREIKKHLEALSGDGPNLATFIKAGNASKADAEKQEEIMRRSENSLQIAKEEVAELEERLRVLAEKLAEDRNVESTATHNAKDFLELHRHVLMQSREIKDLQLLIFQEDERAEEITKKSRRAKKLQTNTDRKKKLIMLEQAKLEEIRRKAIELGIEVPQKEKTSSELMGEERFDSPVSSPGLNTSAAPFTPSAAMLSTNISATPQPTS